MEAWLEDAQSGRTKVHGTLSLGRSSKNTLRLNGDLASRHHALIHSQGLGEYWLVDLGSTNGTLHRGRRIWQPVPLADGDIIEIGGERFVFRKSGADDPTGRTGATRRQETANVRTHTIWMLLADIEQSSALSQRLTPEQFSITVGTWFRVCKESIEASAGIINKYLGDGFLAHWDHRQEAPGEILKTLTRLKQQRETRDPLFRTILHRGEVAMSDDPEMGEVSLLGADLHFLFRMEKVAGTAGWSLVLSEAAAREINPVHPTVRLGEREVAGFPGAHSFYTLNAG